jgi:hypothetical protein
MKLPPLPAVCTCLTLAFAASACFAQSATPMTDAPSASKTRKVAQASVPTPKATAARAGARQQSTPAATQISPVEERRFQNCHGKESDA